MSEELRLVLQKMEEMNTELGTVLQKMEEMHTELRTELKTDIAELRTNVINLRGFRILHPKSFFSTSN